ncbi:hypothetical protein TNCV_864161 [Trichonephila clavipes]|nr:hypothetical protein TNCV_864161 [Trichonephila clavipes]
MATPPISTSTTKALNWRGGKYSPSPALVVSAVTTHKTFRPTYFSSTYSVCTRKVYLVASDIEPKPSGLGSDALTTRLPTAGRPRFDALCHQIPSEYTWNSCSLNQWVRSLVG